MLSRTSPILADARKLAHSTYVPTLRRLRGPLERVVHTFRWPPPFAPCDAPDVLDPRAREFVLTLSYAHVRATCLAVSRKACASRSHPFTHVSGLHLAALPNTPTARVQLQRFVIEKVWPPRLRCRRFEATLLELVSLPTRPPGTQLLQLSLQPPRARKISPTRLAALPTQ